MQNLWMASYLLQTKLVIRLKTLGFRRKSLVRTQIIHNAFKGLKAKDWGWRSSYMYIVYLQRPRDKSQEFVVISLPRCWHIWCCRIVKRRRKGVKHTKDWHGRTGRGVRRHKWYCTGGAFRCRCRLYSASHNKQGAAWGREPASHKKRERQKEKEKEKEREEGEEGERWVQ